MSFARRISEHPWLSLTVSAATIISTALAVITWLNPPGSVKHGSAEPEIQKPDEPATKAANELVGVWELQSPPQADWTVEYKADGTYLLTMPGARIRGLYEAEAGTFSSRAPDIGSSDEGNYRLIDADTLEMTGKLGVSVWTRRQ